MAGQAVLAPPRELRTWFGRRSVRMTGSALVWQEEPEAFHIPYGRIHRVHAVPGRGVLWDLCVEVDPPGRGERSEFRLGTTDAKAQAFADAINAQRLKRLAEAPADPTRIRVEPFRRPRPLRPAGWQLGLLALFAGCLTESVALALLGHPVRAGFVWAGFTAWWVSAAWAANLPWQLRYWRQQQALGELRPAEFTGSYLGEYRVHDVRGHSRSTRRTLRYTYRVTDQLGTAQRHECSAADVRDVTRPRTVLVVPGRLSADTPGRLAGHLVWMGVTGLPTLVAGLVGLVLVPGLLLP
ncbi:hypothetical protein [Kitasatospora sp. NPDC059817]|uniref:hypothetical protein n=1 Tax=Kitasatospora sp. NPDC059817 TaxID=3346961 RepID=UPI0036493F48